MGNGNGKGKWEGGVVGGIRNGKWKEGKVGCGNKKGKANQGNRNGKRDGELGGKGRRVRLVFGLVMRGAGQAI